MTAHGPDAETSERASSGELKPHKIDNTMAFMFESRFAMTVSAHALHSAELQPDYFEAWQHIRRRFPKRFAQSAMSAGTRSSQ
jgi:homogentisate 1,2-dioxygenase